MEFSDWPTDMAEEAGAKLRSRWPDRVGTDDDVGERPVVSSSPKPPLTATAVDRAMEVSEERHGM